MRPHSTVDEATPNPNGVIAQNLVRLAALAGETPGADVQTGCSRASRRPPKPVRPRGPLNALDLRLRAAEIVVTGPEADASASGAQLPFLDRIVLRARLAADLPAGHPHRPRSRPRPEARLHLRRLTCSLPVTNAGEIAPAVAGMRA